MWPHSSLLTGTLSTWLERLCLQEECSDSEGVCSDWELASEPPHLQDGSLPQALRTDPQRRQLPPRQQCLLLSVQCRRGLGAGGECSVLSRHALGSLWSHSFVTVRLWVPVHRPRGEADLQVGVSTRRRQRARLRSGDHPLQLPGCA